METQTPTEMRSRICRLFRRSCECTGHDRRFPSTSFCESIAQLTSTLTPSSTARDSGRRFSGEPHEPTLLNTPRICSAVNVTFRFPTATWASFARTPRSSRFRRCCCPPSPDNAVRRCPGQNNLATRREIASDGRDGRCTTATANLLSADDSFSCHTSSAIYRGSGDSFEENRADAMCLVRCASRQMS